MTDSVARLGLFPSDEFVEFAAAECNQPMHHRFEQQAARYPESLAVRLPSGDVTYAELNAAANRAARRLLATAGSDTRPVALLIDQGYESIVWTLATLKAGRCYAPLDQRLREDVLRGMIEDLGPAALVAGRRYFGLAQNLATDEVFVLDTEATFDRFAPDNLAEPSSPDHIAYVFYTSGSSGAPKGVADSHRNVLHNIMRYTNSLKFAPGDILSLVQNPSFSGTVSSLFGALLNGAAVAPYDLQGEGLQKISQWMRRSRVSVFHAVPSIFRQLSDPVGKFPDVRLIRLEGDRAAVLDSQRYRENFRDDCVLVNGLGATECGLVRQFFIGKSAQLEGEPLLPVGYPVADTTVRVVDDRGQELPHGSTGEIVVESRFLATGYWRQAALTAERFVALGEGARSYRTGDLGRMSADGCLFHLGRIDQRVRIAGHFVAPADVEKVLLEIPGILQATVRDYVDRFGERRLCAYLVARTGAGMTQTELRAALSQRIPAHPIPNAFVFLDALPLSKDCKIDYARLPPPGRQRPSLLNDFVAPRTELEQRMAEIWAEVLEVAPVGVTDSFFDLGGDSLHAVRVVSRLRAQGREVSTVSLFEHPTIDALAGLLERERPASRDHGAR